MRNLRLEIILSTTGIKSNNKSFIDLYSKSRRDFLRSDIIGTRAKNSEGSVPL
jgi:hypothetical protein